jgi:phosphoribosylformimino-5-aminoimidazole carboxamide ribotide isomerase
VNLYPAIDILGGNAVRLVKGDFEAKKVYDQDPLSAARAFAEEGARYLHVVDLDGARAGAPANLHHVEAIAALGVPVQVGGGLRTLDDVRGALEAGATRVILGTAAYKDVDFLDDALAAHGERVVVSVDARGGKLATAGWTEQTQLEAGAAIARLQARGVRSFVYSNIERDGMLEGPDPDEVAEVAAQVRGRFIYSGGIGGLDHLRALAGLRQVNLIGVIVGTALYERRFTVAAAQAALDGG